MKNQYTGDINDFLKYALLRSLQSVRGDQPLFVAWMLTADDSGPDGNKTDYLKQEDRYRSVDPELFDCLKDIVDSGNREVSTVERAGILPRATFFAGEVPAEPAERDRYGSLMAESCPDGALVFFDPDNGIEISRRSPKHLEWAEFSEVVGTDKPFVIYQHNARPKGGLDQHFADLKSKAEKFAPGRQVVVVRGPHAGFLVGFDSGHGDEMRNAVEEFSEKWPDSLEIA